MIGDRLTIADLDSIIAGGDAPQAPRRVQRKATEALDETSTIDDFINSFAPYVADFIKQNRGAFDSDDHEAFNEFRAVLDNEAVIDRIMEALAAEDVPEVPKEEEKDTNDEQLPLDDNKDQSSSDADDASDLVSDDVMALLDSDEESK